MLAAVLLVTFSVLAQGQPLTVALFHKADPAVPAVVGARVQADFRDVLEHTGTVKLQGAADTALGVEEAAKAGWRCDGAAACLAVLGRSLAVSLVLEEEVSGKGATPRVKVRAIDVATGTELSQSETVLPEDLAAWPVALRGVAEGLPLFGGIIRFHFFKPAARVTVDKKEYDAPGPHLVLGGLAPGPHKVQVILEDLTDAEAQVEVRPGEISGVWVAMEHGDIKLWTPRPPVPDVAGPPPPRSHALRRGGLWSGLAAVALTVVGGLGAVGAAVSGVVGSWLVVSLPREPDSGRVLARDGQTRLSVLGLLGTGMTLWGVGLALSAVAVVACLLAAALGTAGVVMLQVDSRRAEEP
jgi:hypothetical protein